MLEFGEGGNSTGMRDSDNDKDRGNESSFFIESADWNSAPDDKAGVAPIK